jgi:monoamine oxidase
LRETAKPVAKSCEASRLHAAAGAERKTVDADAIVIGAGAAGLAAARRLAERAVRVILLEARDRVGGRAWSRRVTRIATPAELGAEFIHGRAPETMALLRESGMAAIDTGDQAWAPGADGGLQRQERDFLSAASLFEKTRTLSSDESAARFLERFEKRAATREAANAARVFVEAFEAADPAIASARAIGEEVRTGVDFTSSRPLGGYRPIFQRLHDACAAAGVQIRFSTAVRRIAWRRGAVAIEVVDAAGGARLLRARLAVVTLPVGVLRHAGDAYEVAFEPRLPLDKRKALQNLEMGHVVKVVLWFRTPFWARIKDGIYADAAFFRTKDRPFTAYWTTYPVRSELVCAWAGGPKAAALDGSSQADMIARALDGFAALLGARDLARSEFEGGLVHDWSNDPFARGAYSYVRVGGGDARAMLADPVAQTLFFAGEATSTDGQGGTVNGALQTGERAAAEAAAAIG